MKRIGKAVVAICVALSLGFAGDALAQIATGNIYGTVKDESGGVLPGVTVTLSGETGTRTSSAGPTGTFRFLNLTRGRYLLTLELSGFATLNRELQVVTGENVELALNMKLSAIQETVEVSIETPLVDTKKRGTATTMTAAELSDVPNARDPWGVLRNVPGVLLDRVNIAGNENGQQADAAGKGSEDGDKMWNLDGLVITDMAATGASPDYFDFGAFDEITITTGGNDLNVQTGGIGINLTTKRGTNTFHGSARYFFAHDDLQSSNLPAELAGDPRLENADGSFRDKADHIQQISEFGFDLGGPLIRDKLWFYGTWGKQDIRLTRLTGTPDRTLLPSYNFKVNWQATPNTMVSGFYFVGEKQKFGRQASYALEQSDDFLWNQGVQTTEGGLPGGLWKLQVDHTFSSNLFVSAKAAYYDTGFGFTARGGADQSFTLDYVNGTAFGSDIDYKSLRPQTVLTADGNYFFEGLGGGNELKFGFAYRDLSTNSVSSYNGNQLVGVINGDTPDDNYAWVARNANTKYSGKYTSAYLGDVLTKGRWTLNAGLRWDRQTARNDASEVPANASLPNVVPGVSFAGSDGNVAEWNDLSPRVGLSYALGDDRKTVVRASYARYASQLSFGDVTDENPVQYGYLAYSWNDLNGDRFVQPNEVLLDRFQYNTNIDPDDPGAAGSTINKVDRDLKAKRDHEIVLGLDHELAPSLSVGVAYTWRRASDWAYRPYLAGSCTGDPSQANCPILGPESYIQNDPVTANGYTAFTWSPDRDLVALGGGGRLRTNLSDYYTTFNGLELSVTKRLSKRWMGRLAASWNDWTEHFDGTPVAVGSTYSSGAGSGNPTRTETDPLVEGGQVSKLSGGSGKASFYSSVKWQVYANALVQLPKGFDLSGAFFARQGGPYPYNMRLDAGREGSLNALATPEVDTNRYDDLYNVDLRLGWTQKLAGRATLGLSAELFNVMNNDLVLSRRRQVNSSTFPRIEEIISPRILRFGARFTF